IGFVGVPHGVTVPIEELFGRNVRIGGGVAPVREYLPALRDLVLAGDIHPGRVFDLTLPLTDVAQAYAAMDQRRATKVMLLP
ncbi:MAG: IMP dehydrogenase, partial [Candidatus Phosphoribacter baldrii]